MLERHLELTRRGFSPDAVREALVVCSRELRERARTAEDEDAPEGSARRAVTVQDVGGEEEALAYLERWAAEQSPA